MLHIENLTVHVQSGTSALSKAFIEALLRGPEVGADAEGETSVSGTPADQPPHIGQYWPGQGGVYAGMARGRDGEADYPLILCEEATDQAFSWQGALDHAKTITADGHSDFTVPNRWESALLYANLQDLIDTAHVYWTSTQSSESTAFIQYFNNGGQSDSLKASERRCRFVRRSVI